MSVTPPKYQIVPDYGTFAGIIARRLQAIYKSGFSETMVNRIMALASKHFPAWPVWDERDVILITYGNTLRSDKEEPLKALHRFLNGQLKSTINSVHILPFFPFTSDDGFAVSDFLKVNPILGDWDDIAAISGDFYLMSDLVINHVSSAHPWFRNFIANRSPGKDYFISRQPGTDYTMVTRPRSTDLFTRYITSAGEKEVWTTFSADQIDLNFSNPEVLFEMIRIIIFYIEKGVRFIRLDAIAYLWKCVGTACLHLEETHEIVKLLRDVAEFVRPGTVIITETNVPNRENWSYFGNGSEAHMVYQFSLPPLLLQALYSQSAIYLTAWAKEIPQVQDDQTFLNYTASHDGIGVRPLEGLVPDPVLTDLIDGMTRFGGMVSMKLNKNGSLSPYEINISWFDAMKGTSHGEDGLHEARFLTSQAIMIAMKGIPAFYIHSMLATPNDRKGVEISGRSRSINRSELNEKELIADLKGNTARNRIFNELKRLIGLRKKHSAFHPGSRQFINDFGKDTFAFTRQNLISGETVHCISNITNQSITSDNLIFKNKKGFDLLSGESFSSTDHIPLSPCQTRWIIEQDL